MAIGLVALKYWYSCGAEYIGDVGLVGEWILKSTLPRVLKLFARCCCCRCCCVALVEVVVAEAVELFLDCALGSWVVAWVGDFAMGKDKPRSFPRLATPTPQVKVVR